MKIGLSEGINGMLVTGPSASALSVFMIKPPESVNPFHFKADVIFRSQAGGSRAIGLA